jgi:hypothetical protein
MRIKTIVKLLVAVMNITLFSTTNASAWTVLGGQPLIPGGIQGSGQDARTDFVMKSRTAPFQNAMKLAGLNKKERQAVNNAISRGQFTKCYLKYGDHFIAESYGANGAFVDRDVTFLDRDFKGTKGAPAFCLTVKISSRVARNRRGTRTTGIFADLKIPFECVNFGLERKYEKISFRRAPEASRRPSAPRPTPTPVAPAPTQPVTPAPEQPRIETNNSPTCEKVKAPEHISPGMGFIVRFTCSDRDGDSLTLYVETARGLTTFRDETVNGNSITYTYEYRAINGDYTPLEPGFEFITVIAMDSKGATSPEMYINFSVAYDER